MVADVATLAERLFDSLYSWAEDYPHEGGNDDAPDELLGHCRRQFDYLVRPDADRLLLALDLAGKPDASSRIGATVDAVGRFASATDAVVTGKPANWAAGFLDSGEIAAEVGDDGFTALGAAYEAIRLLSAFPEATEPGTVTAGSPTAPSALCDLDEKAIEIVSAGCQLHRSGRLSFSMTELRQRAGCTDDELKKRSGDLQDRGLIARVPGKRVFQIPPQARTAVPPPALGTERH